MGRMKASFGRRLVADLFDYLILSIASYLIFFWITGGHMHDWTDGLWWNLLYLLYGTIVPVLWGGYNIGKRILGIKIKRTDEEKVTWKNMILREVIGKNVIAYLTFGITTIVSVFMIIFREDKKAVHDLIAGTYVRYDGKH
ncbi:RDD family protein [Paraliobacillus ryukyuensis]|uniref:RDD family protein n=1 Tax=Paraliobacillus ryukyuensis TaxID=200904 RepID=UPI0009A63D6D|nr:RDD family protein [Paraliobacillus ryukyuensis]